MAVCEMLWCRITLSVILFLLFHPLFPTQAQCPKGPCRRGQYYDTEANECHPCTLGDTYMNQNKHGCILCKVCSIPDSLKNEVVLKNCTLRTDTVFVCEDGFFRDKVSATCEKCTECDENEMEKRKCRRYKNRVCRPIEKPKTTFPTTKTEEETITMTIQTTNMPLKITRSKSVTRKKKMNKKKSNVTTATRRKPTFLTTPVKETTTLTTPTDTITKSTFPTSTTGISPTTAKQFKITKSNPIFPEKETPRMTAAITSTPFKTTTPKPPYMTSTTNKETTPTTTFTTTPFKSTTVKSKSLRVETGGEITFTNTQSSSAPLLSITPLPKLKPVKIQTDEVTTSGITQSTTASLLSATTKSKFPITMPTKETTSKNISITTEPLQKHEDTKSTATPEEESMEGQDAFVWVLLGIVFLITLLFLYCAYRHFCRKCTGKTPEANWVDGEDKLFLGNDSKKKETETSFSTKARSGTSEEEGLRHNDTD